MAEPFATSEEYEDYGYKNPFTSTQVLNKRLAAASRFVRNQCRGIDQRIDDGLIDPESLVDLVCLMVHRSIPAESQAGYTQVQTTAGPYTQGGTVANPHGDYYLTRQEKQALGCGGQKAFSVDISPDASYRNPLELLP